MGALQSMELTEDESYDAVMPIPMSDKPSYPYGLQICLTKAELEKLGIDMSEAELGGVFHFEAMARITSLNMSSTESGDNIRLEAQITDMGVIGGDVAEPEKSPVASRISSIYKKNAA